MNRRGLRRGLLAIHLAVSVGWLGAVAAYLVLALSAATSTDPEDVRSAWSGMSLIGWRALVPLAVSTVVTGVGLAVTSRWGLFRYYWVSISLLVTVAATLVLVSHMPAVTRTAALARTAAPPGSRDQLGGDLLHAVAGLATLLFVLVLNVYKPPGLTRYGWRRAGKPDLR
jgi:uncharacterized membrane protein